jgi:predicted AlkP superfamily pyrophosphatase or phosphodiesterase
MRIQILIIASSLLTSVLGAVAQDVIHEPHLLIIGIDGCRPDALLAAKAPYVMGLAHNGAASFQAQTGLPSVSGPGWSSALTGVWGEKHHVWANYFPVPDRLNKFPVFFHYLKLARPNALTASIVQWAPINDHIMTNADIMTTLKPDDKVAQAAVLVLENKNPDAIFVHFEDVDITGHTFGFSPTSPQYIKMIETIDGYVGQVVRAMHSRIHYAEENWLVIVTTDHGGHSTTHGQDIPEDRTIFIIVSGPDAARGEIEPPPGIVDVAATALTHLNVPIDPAWQLDGKPVGLRQ